MSAQAPDNVAPRLGRALFDSFPLLEDAPAPALSWISDLIGYLNLRLLTSALESDIGVAGRVAMLRHAAATLSVRALLRVLQASYKAAGRSLTPPVRDLVPKLARDAIRPQAENDSAEAAIRVFREAVTIALDALPALASKRSPSSRGATRAPATGRARVEPDRVVHTALETGSDGPAVQQAVAEMLEEQRGRELLTALKRAPPDSGAFELVRTRVATVGELERQLAEEPVDYEAIDVIIAGLDIGAAKVLLEALAESRSRNTRRGAYERLARMGPEIAPLVQPRLRDARWFVVRNMISLMREAGVAPADAGLSRFVKHTDSRVRREALMLLLSYPESRDQAIADALRDDNRQVLRAGLQAARSGLPDAIVPALTRRLESNDFPPEFRVLALHLLGRSNSVLALDTLLVFVQDGKSMVGRPKLAQKSPEMLAALSALARGWPNERRSEALLDIARQSRDKQIREAVRVADGGGGE